MVSLLKLKKDTNIPQYNNSSLVNCLPFFIFNPLPSAIAWQRQGSVGKEGSNLESNLKTENKKNNKVAVGNTFSALAAYKDSALPSPDKANEKKRAILYEYLSSNQPLSSISAPSTSLLASPPQGGPCPLGGRRQPSAIAWQRQGITNNNLISYNFNKDMKIINSLSVPIPKGSGNNFKNTWFLLEDLQKLLISYFKSIYSLISKAKYNFTPEKIVVELLYYIAIPDGNIFNWYNIIYPQLPCFSLTAPAAVALKRQGAAKADGNSGREQSKHNLAVAADKESDDYPKGVSVISGADKINKSKKFKGRKRINFLKRKNKSIKLLRKYYLSPALWAEGGKETLFKLDLESINKLYSNKFYSLVKILNSFFKKPVELELIRLHHSDSESNILAQLFILILKKKNIRSVINKLYSKNKIKDTNYTLNFDSPFAYPSSPCFSYPKGRGLGEGAYTQSKAKEQNNKIFKLSNYIPVFISGLYIHIGGRLMKEPIIPRITTKKYEKGAIALGKVHSLDKSQITRKNKKGAFTIKITYAQNII